MKKLSIETLQSFSDHLDLAPGVATIRRQGGDAGTDDKLVVAPSRGAKLPDIPKDFEGFEVLVQYGMQASARGW